MNRIISLAALCAVSLVAAEPGLLFPIRDGRKIGFIDKSGKTVVNPQFDSAGEFADGMVRISVGSTSGYMDATGRVRVAPQYDVAQDFEGGRAIVMKEGKYFLIDRDGKTIATIPYRTMGGFHAGLCRVQRPRSKDDEGKTIQTAYGYINRDGAMAIEPQFINASDFPDDGVGLAVVIKDRQWAYIDHAGNAVMTMPIEGHDRADSFHDGLLRWKEEGWWGYKNVKGQLVIKPKYDSVSDFEYGVARVELKGKVTYVDRNGSSVDPPKYRQLKPFAEDFALVSEAGRFGYIDKNRRSSFNLPMLEEAHSFSNGLARVKMDGRFGYLDRSGKFAIKPQFSSASDFRGGLAWVMFAEGTTGYIDVQGNKVWESAPRRAK